MRGNEDARKRGKETVIFRIFCIIFTYRARNCRLYCNGVNRTILLNISPK